MSLFYSKTITIPRGAWVNIHSLQELIDAGVEPGDQLMIKCINRSVMRVAEGDLEPDETTAFNTYSSNDVHVDDANSQALWVKFPVNSGKILVGYAP